MTDHQAQQAYDKLQSVFNYLLWMTRRNRNNEEARQLIADIKRELYASHDVEMSFNPSIYELVYKQTSNTFEFSAY